MIINKDWPKLALKGFCMGIADIVPGVSGGTVALITGVYDQLISSISSVNSTFIKLIFRFNFKAALAHIHFEFLAPLVCGILLAIISMAKLMHYFMENYAVYTWSLFFGLILASILFIAKQIKNLKRLDNIIMVGLGTITGFLIVSLIPVQTPDTYLMIFLSGMIGICAMILPGISGSFILLILGKYIYITSAVKNPFTYDNMMIIGIFVMGCLIGLLSFSKLLNFLLTKYHGKLMCVLLGFMLGSMKKIWPWREVIDQKIIRGKVHVLKDGLYFPTTFNLEVLLAFGLIIFGIVLVFIIESKTQKK